MSVPAWLSGAVFYQIVPDRFRRAGSSCESPHGLLKWDAKPASSKAGSQNSSEASGNHRSSIIGNLEQTISC